MPYHLLFATAVALAPAQSSPDDVARMSATAVGPAVEFAAVGRDMLEQPARLDVRAMSLAEALEELRDLSGAPITYSPSLLRDAPDVSCACDGHTVGEALDGLFRDTDFGWRLMGRQILVERRVSAVEAAGLAVRGSATGETRSIEIADEVRTGGIRGIVRDAATARPLPSVQVYIENSEFGVLTGADGSYALSGVPAGEVSLVARLIGYADARAQVTVVSGETLLHDFAVHSSVLALDAVVVTGTAGGTQRRAIGNVVASVTADEIAEKAPVTSVDQLLGQRTPGLMMMPGTGQVGTGAAVRIRGVGSMTQGSDPIVYVDGVRMDSDPRGGPSQRGGSNVSRLNDIHPADIESIEIIKGPAAATLYGTEASNGVIQIITKRGAQGTPQFDFTMRQGTNWLWAPEERAGLRWMPNPDDPDNPISFNVYRHEIENGNGPVFGYGHLQSYNLSLRGGSDMLRYFASVSRDSDVGVVDHNWNRRLALRANLEMLLSETLTATVSSAYVTTQTRLAQTSIQSDPFSNVEWANPRNLTDGRRGFRGAPPEDWSLVEARGDNDRATSSIELRYKPFSWMTHRLVGGLDSNAYVNFTLFPMLPEGADHFYGTSALGDKEVRRGSRRFITVDYSGSADFRRADYSFQTSVGVQYYQTDNSYIEARGQRFPALPITTVSGGSIRNGEETFVENSQLGFYVQQQVGWQDRAFLTAAVRADNNSAFGAEYDAAIYPKLSGTWVAIENGSGPVSWMNQLRLRAAWGAAGQQPATFAAARLYDPVVGYRDNPSLITGTYGNENLKPERGEELEIGFDASFLNDRISVEFTRYDKAIKDAIVNRQLSPSTGFTGNQIVNLGEMSAWGNEIGITGRVIEGERFSWGLDMQYSTMENRIESVGDEGVIFGGTGMQHREGYSVADIYFLKVLDAEISPTGTLLSALCDGGTGPQGVDQGGAAVPCSVDGEKATQVRMGHSQPTWQLGFGTNMTFFNNLHLSARVEGNGGHMQVNTGIRPMHNGGTTEGATRNDNPILQAYRSHEVDRTGLYDASFLRLREVSLAYDVPESFAGRFGARRGSVSFGMRNLAMLWTGEHGWSTPRNGHIREEIADVIIWDPEVRGNGALSTGYQTVMPPTATATLTVRFSF